MKPITAVVKEKGGAKTYPSNQEVTLNSDGSGGPILMRSGSGPQGLGVKGNNGYKIGSEDAPTKKKDACYSKVKGRYKKWPSAYASGALVKCRKVGAANWGNKSK
tara:strand:+ start:343 stop:657 length:315 start_codon:yes stop_codon:yes gene_type:complete